MELLEFDTVYVMGMAESILPTWQSQNAGEQSPEMEEERRNCFVAITPTKNRLVLARAQRYRGRDRAPSRFLAEMGFDASSILAGALLGVGERPLSPRRAHEILICGPII